MLFEVLFLRGGLKKTRIIDLKNEEKTIDILRKEEYNDLNITEAEKIKRRVLLIRELT